MTTTHRTLALVIVAGLLTACGGSSGAPTEAALTDSSMAIANDPTPTGRTGTDPAVPGPPTAPLEFVDELRPDDGDWAQPYGVDVGPDGTTWVLDTGNHRVVAFDADGAQVVEVGGRGSGPGEFDTLGFGALAVGPDGEVFVVDNGNGRIQVLDPQGDYLREWGSTGDGDGQFQRAIGIAVDADGRVYVSDDARPVVQVFASDGTFLRSFGEEGDGPGGLVHATGIDVDGEGNVWVADFEARRVQVFDAAGQVRAEHQIPARGAGSIPEGVVVLDGGRTWVTDYRAGAVVEVPPRAPDGAATVGPTDPPGEVTPDAPPDAASPDRSEGGSEEELPTWPVVAGDGRSGPGSFQAPVDLAVSPSGQLVVTDQRANTVQRFGPMG